MVIILAAYCAPFMFLPRYFKYV